MDLENDKRFTYANLRVMDIKNKLYNISDDFNLFDDIEIINVALVVFSILCDTHANADLERHLIIEDMLDEKTEFIHYVKDLIQQSNNTNEVLTAYIEKEIIKRNHIQQ